MYTYETRLRESLPRVTERIDNALGRAGRSDSVTVVAVTKGHPLDALRAALAVGLEDLGENRVAELESKRAEIDAGPRWHLIGHLQRNKVRRALPLFDLLHSLDSLRLARTLSQEAERAGAQVHCLVQVNASGEQSKGGFEVAEGVGPITEVAALPGLRVDGLMTMAPFTDDESVLRTTFQGTRRLFDDCIAQVDGFNGHHLSMGMTNDFELAVEEGSTMVRLGTVLFGERPQGGD